MANEELRSAFSLPWIIESDYTHALLHLAWIKMVQSDDYVLVFGMVELFPSECPPPDPTPLSTPHSTFDPGNFRGWVQRFRLSAESALAWYESSRAGDVLWLAPSGSESGDVRQSVGTLAEEPPWPYTATTSDLPFLNGTWGAVRAHHLCQPQRTESLAAVLASNSAVAWFADHLFFDFHDYPEWLGSVSLIAPNPVYRLLDRHHRTRGNQTYTGVHIIPRSCMPLTSLRLELSEFGPRGLTAVHTISDPQPYTLVAHVGTMKSISHRVVCDHRGVLDWSVAGGYLHVFQLQSETSVVQHETSAPAMGKVPSGQYAIPMYQETFATQIGSAPPMAPAGAFLMETERQRQARESAEQHEEYFFFEQPIEALEFVRRLIAAARRRLWIIDPYFDSAAFLHTVSAISRYSVDIVILAGGEHLSEKPVGDDTVEYGGELGAQIANFHLASHIKAFVMSSGTPAFHDRFLAIDDAIWFAGNSFNSLGDRASMLVRLNNPGRIRERIEDIMSKPDRVQPLADWLARPQQERKGPTPTDSTDEESGPSTEGVDL